jgi:hypothetical protein
MKKYEKPQIVYERYELSQNIADCTWNLNSADVNSCVGDGNDNGIDAKLFMTSNGCDFADDKLEEYCYTVATSGKVVFKS